MSFQRLTSGERKRLQQGILTPQQATQISARAEARNPDGFWSTTWGTVIRAVGIAALNFIPGVGGVASQAAGAYDANRAATLQKKAQADYQAAFGAKAPPPSVPLTVTSPYPWLPDYGNIGYTPGYAGGTYAVGTGGEGAGTVIDDTVAAIQDAVSGFTPMTWLLIAGAAIVLLFLFVRR